MVKNESQLFNENAGMIDVLTGLIYEGLGLSLQEMRDFTNTIILLEKAHDILQLCLGEYHPATKKVKMEVDEASLVSQQSFIS